MTRIPSAQNLPIPIVRSAELAHAPTVVVRIGVAPDGLPWLLRVDRSGELHTLFRAVCSVFGVPSRDALPERVRVAVETHVASGLMGVHDAEVTSGGPSACYVSRNPAAQLLGPTLLSQVLEPPRPPRRAGTFPPPISRDEDDLLEEHTGVVAVAALDEVRIAALERSAEGRRATRRLLIELESGRPYTGAVSDDARVLRTPRGPYRPLHDEQLLAIGGVVALVSGSAGTHRVALEDRAGLRDALTRARTERYGGSLTFEVPRARLLARFADAAAALVSLHEAERIHGDLSPKNVLFTRGASTVFDSLDVPVGTPSAAATFRWAAPEQIIGLPVDPRTDVFALGKLTTALLGGVPFGEQTQYVIPTGGSASKTVNLLKCEGVFVDCSNRDVPRAWQVAWQEFLGRCLAYDRERRPTDARAFASELRALVEEHPPTGALAMEGAFGAIVALEDGDFARMISD